MAKYELPSDLLAFWKPDLVREAGKIAIELPKEQIEPIMVQAAQFMNLLPWRGAKKSILNNLCWPRVGGVLNDGSLFPDNKIPDEVKECQIIVSYFIAAKIPCDIPAMTHIMLTIGHLLIESTDIRKGDIRPWNSSIH